MNRFFQSKLALVVLVAAVVSVGMALGRVILQNRELAREVGAISSEAAALEAKNTELAAFLSRLQSQVYLEQEARLKLGLQKPGEQMLLVRRADGASGSAFEETRRLETNTERWWRYFFAPDERPRTL